MVLGRPFGIHFNLNTLTLIFFTRRTAVGKEWRQLMIRARKFDNWKDVPMVQESVLAEKYFM